MQRQQQAAAIAGWRERLDPPTVQGGPAHSGTEPEDVEPAWSEVGGGCETDRDTDAYSSAEGDANEDEWLYRHGVVDSMSSEEGPLTAYETFGWR
jgi:hypothetical protein